VEKTVLLKFMDKPKFILIFDVDGVLTDPQTKRVDIGLSNKISKFVRMGIPVALNTGRSDAWLEGEVLSHLSGKIFVSCEKGAVWGIFDGKTFEERVDLSISVPEELKDEVKELVVGNYSDCAFYDEGKMTMVTVEMKSDFPIEKFPQRRKTLAKDIYSVIEKVGLQEKLRVVETVISVDIDDIKTGKGLGARRILDLLNKEGVRPQEFITVGDEESDILMAEEFVKNGLKTKFVFVGKGTIEAEYPFPIITTKNKFAEGTSEFLEKLSF
jgi:hydroxymethylpyrimidine pyrophosphatase-like HAD family hydrolase